MRWAWRVACRGWGGGDLRTVLWLGHLGERGHFEEISIDGKIILTWILNKYYWEAGVDWIDLAQDRGK